jgi:putative ABC transport system permease protein
MAWWHRAQVLVSRLLRPGVEERALEEEIRFHLEMEARKEMRRGLPPAEARRRAEQRFGHAERVRRSLWDRRGARRTEDGMRDVRHAVRGLLRAPGFSALALITLALGIGATTVAFTLVDGVLLKPLPYADPERLVLIDEVRDDGRVLPPSFPNFVDWRSQARGFDGMASLMFPFGQSVRAYGEPLRVQVAGVSDGLFRLLGVRPILGREFSPDESRPETPMAVMVSYEFWRERLNAERDLGSISLAAFGGPVPVVGVLPPDFRFLHAAELYFPHERWPSTMRSAHNYRVVGRLAPDATHAGARSAMTALSRRLKQQFGDDTQAVDAHVVPLHAYVVGDHARLLALLLGAAGLVLLIACANLVSGQLARGTARRRELAVRAALGAGRGRLVRQLGVESLVLALGGAALGIGLAIVLLHVIRTVGAGMLPRLAEVSVDTRALGFSVAVTVLTALLTGLLPALRLSSDSLASLRMRGGGTGVEGRSPVWRVLVGFEVALAVPLLIASGLLIRTLHNILTVDAGFDARGVLTVAFSPEEADLAQFDRIERAVADLTGVERAGLINVLPLTWGSTAGPVLRPEDIVPEWPAYAGFRVVSPSYFEALRMPLLRGRGFTVDDRAGTELVAIVSQPLAAVLWPGEEPIGQRVRTNYLSELWLTVVGVVPEARRWNQPVGGQHEIYTPLAQHPSHGGNGLTLVVRTNADPASLMPAVRARLREAAPDVPFEFGTLDERLAATARDRRFAMLVLNGFASVALILAVVGIHGVVSYGVAVRTREIGVRIALGATPASVRRGVVSGAARVATAGIAIGLVAALLVTRALEGLLFGVPRVDPFTFAGAGVVLFACALLAAYLPARRSSRVDPIVALRAE